MDVLYYSNNCKHSQKLLAHLAKIGVLDRYNFICIDRRSVDPNTRQVSITLDRGVKTTLPPNVSRVPTLLLVNKKFTAIVGDDIYNYVNENVKKDPDNLAVENGGEPIGYILSPSSGGVNIVSETYTMYNAPPEELSAKGTGATRQMHNYVSVNREQNFIPTPQDEYSKKQTEIGAGAGGGIGEELKSSIANMFPSENSSASIPTNSTTYNAYSIPGVMYNTGKLIVPELQRPPPQHHIKLGEDVTVDSLQQQRNMDLNNSLPFIAKQLNHIISPEVSNIYPPGSEFNRGDGSKDGDGSRGGYYNASAYQNAQQLSSHTNQKLNSRDSQNILYGRQSRETQQNEICYL